MSLDFIFRLSFPDDPYCYVYCAEFGKHREVKRNLKVIILSSGISYGARSWMRQVKQPTLSIKFKRILQILVIKIH